MAEHIAGWRAEQALQQFVNQSTWQWGPVRRALARRLTSLYRPRAWVVGETVFTKNGTSSVGVARQFSPSAGRLLNCQLGLTAFLAGPAGAAPVNWRLLLPPSWDESSALRARAHVPEGERYQQRWQAVLALIDEMAAVWELPGAPVVVDAWHGVQIEPLLTGLEERRMRYLVQVPHDPAVPLPSAGPEPAGLVPKQRTRDGAATINWWAVENGRRQASQFVLEPFPVRPSTTPGAGPWHRGRKQLTEWSAGQPYPASTWLTNVSATMPELIELTRVGTDVERETARLYDDVGLTHFEGRSFRGWHHHVTLASLAHAFLLGRRVAEQKT